MPIALVAALIASLGVHAAALFVAETEPLPAVEPLPLQAEIVLRPRPAPLAKPESPAPKPALRKKPMPAPVAVPATAAVVDAVSPADGDAVPVADAEMPPLPLAEAPLATAMPEAMARDRSAAVSPQLPATGEIRYRVQRGEPPTIIGYARHRWSMSEGRYRIVSVMETSGVAAWVRAVRLETESSGALVADGLAPERYLSRRTDRGRERVELVDFDRAAGLVRFGNGATAPLPAGVQDLLSFNYQLGWLARTGDMEIVTGRKLGTFRLELLGKEWLETPQQQVWTLRFRASGETVTEVWLAPDNHLLPVKIRHIDKKGERFEQVVEEIRLDPPPDDAS